MSKKICILMYVLLSLFACTNKSEKEQTDFVKEVYMEYNSICKYAENPNRYYPLYRKLCKDYFTEDFRRKSMEAYAKMRCELLVAGFLPDDNSFKNMTVERISANVYCVHYVTFRKDDKKHEVDLKVFLCKENGEYKISDVENISAEKIGNSNLSVDSFSIDDLRDSISKCPEKDLAIQQKLCGYWMLCDYDERVIKVTKDSVGYYDTSSSADAFDLTPYVVRNQYFFADFDDSGLFPIRYKCIFKNDTLYIRGCENELDNMEWVRLKDEDVKDRIEYIRKLKQQNKDGEADD